jgi:type IV pilus assembly protein PilW
MHAPLQRGLSLIELMVGLALGLFIVAVATSLLVNRVREHREQLIEARLMQDLRTSADLVTRELRRAGHWGDATAAIRRTTANPQTNPYAAVAPGASASDAVSFRFSRDSVEDQVVDANEQFGFRLRQGVVDMLLGSGNWQALTDGGTMTVTAFSVVPLVQEIALDALCNTPCAGGGACLPRQQVRSFSVAISARAVADAKLLRNVRSSVRLRNDAIVGACAA